jgi:ribosomal 30S subunit maturation factor RimM
MHQTKKFEDIPDDQICFGYVSGIFGVRGEARVFLYNPESKFLFSSRTVFLVDEKGKATSCRLKARTGAGKKVIARIEGIESREEARACIGLGGEGVP